MLLQLLPMFQVTTTIKRAVYRLHSISLCLTLIFMMSSHLDFILDTASVNTRSPELEEETRKTVNTLVEQFNSRKTTMLESQIPAQPMGKLKEINPQFAHFGKAFPLLTRRSFVNMFRRKGLYFNRIFQPVMVAIIVTIFFAPLSNGPDGLISRLGLLQHTTPIMFSGMLNNFSIYPFEVRLCFTFFFLLFIQRSFKLTSLSCASMLA